MCVCVFLVFSCLNTKPFQILYFELLTAAQVYDKRSIEVFVPDECCMNSGTGGMVDGKVTQLFVATKEITFLLIYHQFLKPQDHKSIII